MVAAWLLGMLPLLVIFGQDNAVTRILALPALYLCPGYLLIAALAPQGTLDGVPRLALSIVVSLAVLMLAAVLVDQVHIAIDARSTALALVAVDGAAALVWALRSGPGIPRRLRIGPDRNWVRIAASAAGLGIAGAILIAAYGLAVDGAVSQHYAGTVQAWVLQGAAGQGGSPQAQIGVRNMETAAITCQASGSAPGGDMAWPAFSLEPGATWSGEANVPASPAPGTAFRVQIHCQLPDGTTLDRSLLRTMT